MSATFLTEPPTSNQMSAHERAALLARMEKLEQLVLSPGVDAAAGAPAGAGAPLSPLRQPPPQFRGNENFKYMAAWHAKLDAANVLKAFETQQCAPPRPALARARAHAPAAAAVRSALRVLTRCGANPTRAQVPQAV